MSSPTLAELHRLGLDLVDPEGSEDYWEMLSWENDALPSGGWMGEDGDDAPKSAGCHPELTDGPGRGRQR